MTPEIKACRTQVARAAVISLVAGVVAVGIAYAIAKATGKPQLAADIAMGGGLLLLAGLPGLVLSVVMTGKVRGGASMGFIGGIAIRLPAGGVLALYGLNWGLAQTQSFSQIIATAYLVLLVIEVVCLSPAVKRTAAVESKNTPPVETQESGDEESV